MNGNHKAVIVEVKCVGSVTGLELLSKWANVPLKLRRFCGRGWEARLLCTWTTHRRLGVRSLPCAGWEGGFIKSCCGRAMTTTLPELSSWPRREEEEPSALHQEREDRASSSLGPSRRQSAGNKYLFIYFR